MPFLIFIAEILIKSVVLKVFWDLFLIKIFNIGVNFVQAFVIALTLNLVTSFFHFKVSYTERKEE